MDLRGFFDGKAGERDGWIGKNRYYNEEIARFMRFHIPEGSSVLEIGSGTGSLLDAVKPKTGVGVDFSGEMVRIASEKYPHLRFIRQDAAEYRLAGKFDYIIISDTAGFFTDVQQVLRNIRQNCTHRTRVIITTYNYLWEPLLKAAEKLGLKMEQPFTNWLTTDDLAGLLYLEDYDVVKRGDRTLIPKRIPLLSEFCNRYLINLPLMRELCLVKYIIARPMNVEPRAEKTVSIVVPARNEAGNIRRIVESLPALGAGTEIVFVEGGSSDDTWAEILKASKTGGKAVKCARQDGKGKGDAVRKGFELASGQVLMIYDADMTVPPEDLMKFYEAIASNRGEFINGSRLVYPMETEAMRALNLFGNKMFSVMFSWIIGQRIKDTLCGTKVIYRGDYEVLKGNRGFFGDFDPFGDFDLLFGASKMDLRIVEIPIRYRERTYGATNISRIRHGWLLLKMCAVGTKKLRFGLR